jgi:hypothetical protein
MARIKKITITVDQAEDLEEAMGSYLSAEEPYEAAPFGEAIQILRQAKVPKALIKRLKEICDSLAQDIEIIRGGDIQRYVICDVAEGVKHLDDFLAKVFKVTGTRGNKPYMWEVWN